MNARPKYTRHLANDFDVTERGTRINIDTHRHWINVEVTHGNNPPTQILELTVEQFANLLVTGSTTSLVPADELRQQLLIVAAERDQLAEKLERMRKKGKTRVEVFGKESKS